MSALPPFHLAMFARDLDETKNFYTKLLGATLSHESDDKWMNIEWFGHQLTFHERLDMEVNGKNDFHWGFNVNMEEFESLAERIRNTNGLDFETEPTWKDKGTEIERIKMYLKDPNGHLIEVKYFPNKSF